AQARNVSLTGLRGDRRELRRVRVSVILRAALAQGRWPAGARRAPRALEDVRKVLTRPFGPGKDGDQDGDQTGCGNGLCRLMLDPPAHAVGVERGRAEMPRCAGSRYRCPGLSSLRSILPVILSATAVLSG